MEALELPLRVQSQSGYEGVPDKLRRSSRPRGFASLFFASCDCLGPREDLNPPRPRSGELS